MKYLRRYDSEELTSLETEYSTLPTKFITYSSNFQKSTLVRNKRYIPAEYVEMKRGQENYIKTGYRANKNTNVRIIFDLYDGDNTNGGWILGAGSFEIFINTGGYNQAHYGIRAATNVYDSPLFCNTEDDLGIDSTNLNEKNQEEIFDHKFEVILNNQSIEIKRYSVDGSQILNTWRHADISVWDNETDTETALNASDYYYYNTPYATIYLFVNHRGWNNNKEDGGSYIYGYTRNARIYYCKFWEGTETMREYIPIYDIVDKKYGFHETVSDTYTFGATSGLFEGNTKINNYTER